MGRTSAAKNSIKAAARVFLMRNVGYTERGSSGGAIMELTIYVKKIVRAMIIAVLLITLVSFVARVAMYIWGQEGYLQPLRIFDVGEERSIPTWFETMQFLLCSILLAVITAAKKQRSDRYSLHWSFLSIIFLVLSLDEVASIHEAIGQLSERLLHNTTGFIPSGAISFFWVVPGTIFVVIVLVAYLRFLAHLPRSTRRLFLLVVFDGTSLMRSPFAVRSWWLSCR